MDKELIMSDDLRWGGLSYNVGDGSAEREMAYKAKMSMLDPVDDVLKQFQKQEMINADREFNFDKYNKELALKEEALEESKRDNMARVAASISNSKRAHQDPMEKLAMDIEKYERTYGKTAALNATNRGKSGKGTSGKGFSALDMTLDMLKKTGHEDSVDADNMMEWVRNLDDVAPNKTVARKMINDAFSDQSLQGWFFGRDSASFKPVSPEDAAGYLLQDASLNKASKRAYTY